MTIQTPLLARVAIPDNAPFSAEQREWLSGFFTAALAPMMPAGASTALAGLGAAPARPDGPVLADNDDAPWHDPSMPAPERMELARDAAPAPRLMAAMAQQDCGQCGYNCADYANAIFLRKEERLNLCVPGGKETLRLVKQLVAERPDDAKAPEAGPGAEATVPAPEPGAKPMQVVGSSRDAPAEVVFLSRRRLNAEGSEKETFHVEFDISGSAMRYRAGDSFGLFPRNDPGYVDQIIAMLGVSPKLPVRGRSLREVLAEEVALGAAPDALFELYSFVAGGEMRARLQALARGEDPDGDAAQLDVFAVVQKFGQVRPHPEAFVDALEPLQPRLYSISSSPSAAPGRLSLTVDAVRYTIGRRRRLGVASTFIGHGAAEGERIRAYIQKAHAFALPEDPAVPVVMIGPGTGIAPFRSFLHERRACAAPGRNWLFYGHRHAATDFFYRDELEEMQRSGHLTRLSLAWSRDGDEKVYVQDRIRAEGAELWSWIEAGAHLYVCGDAKRMAKDVEAALVDVVAAHGKRSGADAADLVGTLKKQGRYQADVY